MAGHAAYRTARSVGFRTVTDTAAAREAGAEGRAIATIADRATGAAERFADAGIEYRFVYSLDELGLA